MISHQDFCCSLELQPLLRIELRHLLDIGFADSSLKHLGSDVIQDVGIAVATILHLQQKKRRKEKGKKLMTRGLVLIMSQVKELREKYYLISLAFSFPELLLGDAVIQLQTYQAMFRVNVV